MADNEDKKIVGRVLEVTDAPLSEANAFYTADKKGAVKLQMGTHSTFSQIPPQTVHRQLAEVVKEFPSRPALAYKVTPDAPEWTYYSYQEYYDMSCLMAKACIKMGLHPFQAVGILGFNSVEWFVANMGAIFAGGLSCGVYATNNPPVCQYIALDSDAGVFVVENEAQMAKLVAVKSELPALKAIVQYRGKITNKQPYQFLWDEFLEMGKSIPDSVLIQRLSAQSPNQCCALIYTSGTTGSPKGVMLSHDNLTWTSKWLSNTLPKPIPPQTDVCLSYLPLSHIAAQICDIYLMVARGGVIHCAQPDALRGSLGTSLKESRPTLFLGVPRVWEKIREAMIEKGKELSFLKRWVARWAKYVGYYGVVATADNQPVPWGWTLANMVVLSGVKRTLGLDRCHCFSAAAPLSRETLDFFCSLGIPLYEVYGMSETSGPQTISAPPDAFRPGSGGKTPPGGRLRLDDSVQFRMGAAGKTHPGGLTRLDADNQSESSGQVCMQGRNVFMGYLGAQDKNQEAFDKEGWLRSGDLGYVDSDGFLFITGRIKEMIITSGGENVAPVPIEDNIKAVLPVIRNAMVIGDQKKFLSILLTFKTLADENQNPTETLEPNVIQWVQSLGVPGTVTTISQLLDVMKTSPAIGAALQAGLDKVNNESLSRASRVQKFAILPCEFSISGGELGPTLKMRRPKVVEKYHDTIEQLYLES